MAATIGQKHKNGFKIVENWDNPSQSLENNLYNDFKGPEHLLGGMNLENEIDTCQTTVLRRETRQKISKWFLVGHCFVKDNFFVKCFLSNSMEFDKYLTYLTKLPGI